MASEILVYTDPHHGLDLRANTTPASRKRLDLAIRDLARKVTSSSGAVKVCVGDFYHKFSNSEDVMAESSQSLIDTDFILGGNHDVRNDSESVSSLGLMKALTGGSGIFMPELGKAVMHHRHVDLDGLGSGVNLVFVPHHSTKESFSEALTQAHAHAGSFGLEVASILFLHCNYDCEMSDKDTEMNLSREVAETLLDAFEYIIIGHDHNPKEDFDGRVIVVGSLHPTNFGDCQSSKRYLSISAEDGKLLVSDKVSWSRDQFIHVEPGRLDEVDKKVHQFIRVSGKVSPAEVGPITKQMKEWLEDENVFAVRADLKVVTEVSDEDKFDSASESSSAKVTEIITRELKSQSPELLSLWQSLISEDTDNA